MKVCLYISIGGICPQKGYLRQCSPRTVQTVTFSKEIQIVRCKHRKGDFNLWFWIQLIQSKNIPQIINYENFNYIFSIFEDKTNYQMSD